MLVYFMVIYLFIYCIVNEVYSLSKNVDRRLISMAMFLQRLSFSGKHDSCFDNLCSFNISCILMKFMLDYYVFFGYV